MISVVGDLCRVVDVEYSMMLTARSQFVRSLIKKTIKFNSFLSDSHFPLYFSPLISLSAIHEQMTRNPNPNEFELSAINKVLSCRCERDFVEIEKFPRSFAD